MKLEFIEFVIICSIICVNGDGKTDEVTSQLEPDMSIWRISPETFSINCLLKDIANPSPRQVTWKKGDTVLSNNKDGYKITWSMIANEAKSVLKVAHSKVDHSGLYTCVPLQGGSTSVEVYVIDVTTVDANVSADVAELRCMPDTSQPSVTNQLLAGHKWTRNGVQVTAGGNLKIYEKNFTIVITDPKKDQAGQYNCEFEISVTTAGGKSRIIKLVKAVHLFSEPRVKRLPKSENLAEGDTLMLNCNVVSGHPTPNVTWLKDDKPIDLKDDRVRLLKSEKPGKIPVEKSVLKIFELKYSDRALYTCVVKNEWGTYSISILVRVKDKLAPLWPFLAIVAEVILLCAIMFVCEKKRSKAKDNDDEVTHKLQSDSTDTKGECRQRKT